MSLHLQTRSGSPVPHVLLVQLPRESYDVVASAGTRRALAFAADPSLFDPFEPPAEKDDPAPRASEEALDQRRAEQELDYLRDALHLFIQAHGPLQPFGLYLAPQPASAPNVLFDADDGDSMTTHRSPSQEILYRSLLNTQLQELLVHFRRVRSLPATTSFVLPLPRPSTEDFISQLPARYTTTRQILGVGGFGIVVKATLEDVGVVAVKCLPTHSEHTAISAGEEAKVLRYLNSSGSHPNVVGFVEAFSSKSRPCFYITMPVVGTTTLHHLIHSSIKALDLDVVASFWDDIIAGLVRVHRKGVLHRDIKPENLLLSHPLGHPMCHLLIGDFGSAVFWFDLVGRKYYPGTEGHEPPEKFDDVLLADQGGYFDGQSDIWAAGSTLFEMITGKPVNWSSTNRKINWEAVPKGVPRSLYRLLHRVLEVNPIDRPTALQLHEARQSSKV